MLTIRPYLSSDADAVRTLHAAQGLPYDFPDLERPEFLVRAVLENGTGHPEMALFLRKTAETYLLFDPRRPKREIIGRMLAMAKECAPAAQRAGFQDIHAWLPPAVEPGFGNILVKLGWVREPWVSYVKAVSL